MTYNDEIEDDMADDQGQVVYKMHWWFFVDKFVPWLIASVVVVVIGNVAILNPLIFDLYQRVHVYAAWFIVGGMMLTFIAAFIQWMFTTLTLEDGYLIYEKGIIRRAVAKIPMQEIASVDLRQSIFQRFLNSGDLTIDMRGASLLRMRQLDNPEGVQNAILRERRETRNLAL